MVGVQSDALKQIRPACAVDELRSACLLRECLRLGLCFCVGVCIEDRHDIGKDMDIDIGKNMDKHMCIGKYMDIG